VLKDTSAFAAYGEKAKDGVIIITSKSRHQKAAGYVKNENGGVVVENQKAQLKDYEESMTAFYKSIQKQIKYPLEARQSGIQGKVYVSFDVAEDGKISNVEASHARYTLLEEIVVVGYPAEGTTPNPKIEDMSVLEEEVIRTIKLLDEITPIEKDGKPIDIRLTLPVTFKLD
jgi:outer membrane biosynthesis protein TonB